ncbi:MAG: DUF938 domain-containing protein [Alphaproteobacteria bacterium]
MIDQPHSSDPDAADPRRFAPSAQRNRQPILDVLSRVLPKSGLVLDLASGSGEHALHFAHNLPSLRWQPSDPDPDCRRSADAHAAAEPCPNLLPAVDLDVTAPEWLVPAADAIVCINMVHISPWSASEGLFVGAGRILSTSGILYLYGPYKRNGRHTAPSNEAFDASLRQRNSAWGIRSLEDIMGLAAQAGIALREVVDMPANNLSLVFGKT